VNEKSGGKRCSLGPETLHKRTESGGGEETPNPGFQEVNTGGKKDDVGKKINVKVEVRESYKRSHSQGKEGHSERQKTFPKVSWGGKKGKGMAIGLINGTQGASRGGESRYGTVFGGARKTKKTVAMRRNHG